MDDGSTARHATAIVIDRARRLHAVLGARLPAHARRRGVVVLVHGRGPAEPWTPSREGLRGVVAACVDNGVAARWDSLGRPVADPGALAELVPPSADPRMLRVQVAGVWCELPRAWVGRHAIVVSPMVLAERPGAVAGAGCHRATLGAIAVAAHARGGDPELVGAAVLAEVFAGFTWVVDGARALVRGPRQRTHTLDADRVVVHGATGWSGDAIASHAATLDRWLDARGRGEGLATQGPLASEPWPVAVGESIGVDGPRWVERGRGRQREAKREAKPEAKRE